MLFIYVLQDLIHRKQLSRQIEKKKKKACCFSCCFFFVFCVKIMMSKFKIFLTNCFPVLHTDK